MLLLEPGLIRDTLTIGLPTVDWI